MQMCPGPGFLGVLVRDEWWEFETLARRLLRFLPSMNLTSASTLGQLEVDGGVGDSYGAVEGSSRRGAAADRRTCLIRRRVKRHVGRRGGGRLGVELDAPTFAVWHAMA